MRSPRNTRAGDPSGRSAPACSSSAGKSAPAASQCSARHATTSRAPVARSHRAVPTVQKARRWSGTGGISSGPSRSTSRGWQNRAGEPGESLRAQVTEAVGGGREREAGGRDVDGGPFQGAADRVRDRAVVLAQFGAAQPQRGPAGPTAAGGERRELRRTTAAGRSDQAQHGGTAPLERGELGEDGRPFDGLDRVGRPGPEHRGGREFPHPGEVEVGAVGRDRRRVAGEQLGERPRGRARWGQRYGEALVAAVGAESGAEDAEHGAGDGVEHRAPGGSAAQAQRVPARGADRQFQRLAEEVRAVGGGVGHGGGAQHARLTPASGGDPHIGAGPDRASRGDRQRCDAEALGADEGQVQRGQRGHRVGRHHTVAVPGAQHEPGQSVDRLVTGEHRPVVVGHEAGTARPAGQVVHPDQDVGGRAAGEPREVTGGSPRMTGFVLGRHRLASRCASVPLSATLGPE
ncbi:conserved hypothetical protein [Streptomyces griseoflavus Tu4000]|uniref:Uncharacterized protein n=1 Tax=Streptomyces griseoflavus Tu4000 TaxID=467200 RepID=D9XV74_9ACTN|nr:conserved hypothetical protein [Streptomyces griseoflavus Tu4000]